MSTYSEFTYTLDGHGCIGGVPDGYDHNAYYINLGNYPGLKFHPKHGDRVKLEQKDNFVNESQYSKIWVNGELVWEWTEKWQEERNKAEREYIDNLKQGIRKARK